MANNSQEYYKFLGKLYDILLEKGIISFKEEDKAKDLKEKKIRLEKYLEKLQRVQDKAIGNDRHLDMIRELYYDSYIIKEEDIPKAYLESLQNQYLEQGHGYIHLVDPQNEKDEKKRREHIDTIIREQKETLDNWLNYFLSEDSSYLPMWAKVWAFQGMLDIGILNIGKDGYKRRGKATVNPFVSFDAEILGKCVEMVQESFKKDKLIDEEVKKLVSSGSFSKLYGKLLANKKQIKAETVEGIWVKYNKETEQEIAKKINNGQEPEYLKLYNSLQGYNTSWCTAGSRNTAKTQILGGDFYVYYSKDKEGQYKIPRLAIRMEGNNIGEIRGIATGQNIESNMEEILEDKLKEFPDAGNYKKKVSDMKKLTEIYNKHKNHQELSKEELRFLYEIDNKINGFGYQKDPRINEIKETRNKKKDLALALDCREDEIALSKFDLNGKIKFYYGDLTLDVTKGEKFNLSKIISIYGDLTIKGLTKAENVVFPHQIFGTLYLKELEKAINVIFPQSIIQNLWLNNLEKAVNVTFSQSVGKKVYLNQLTIAKNVIFPQSTGDDVWLDSLAIAENAVFPQNSIIGCDLHLNSLIRTEGFGFPQSIGRYLYLKKLTSIKGSVLPQNVGNRIILKHLVIGKKRLGGLYRLEEIKKMQRKEMIMEKSLRTNFSKLIKKITNPSRKSRGIVTNTLLLANLVLFGILTFIISLLLMK